MQRMLQIDENGGVVGNHNIYIHAFDANGNPLNGVVVCRVYALQMQPPDPHACRITGEKGPGRTHFDVYAGDIVYVASVDPERKLPRVNIKPGTIPAPHVEVVGTINPENLARGMYVRFPAIVQVKPRLSTVEAVRQIQVFTPEAGTQFGLLPMGLGEDAAPGGEHQCAYYGSCNFCSSDHLPAGEAFQAHRMRGLAPSVRPRAEAGKDIARDALYRVLLRVWAQAAKDGLLRSRPSVRLAGGGVRPERRQTGTWVPLVGSSLSFSRLASKAA